ncbi:MAG: GNAT family N-acetyltransferase [Chlamydiota bacterium]
MHYLSAFFWIGIFCFGTQQICADEVYVDREGNEISIIRAKSFDEIDVIQGKEILVRSFMAGYEDVPLSDLNPTFRSIGDVRRFYEAYFDSEFENFKQGNMIWIQAFEKEKLLGWATFELEDDGNAAYMNLLAVGPSFQGKGIGKHLTFSILSADLFPDIQEVRLLLRNINESGRKFYEKIGFFDFKYAREDNFVDISLLTGLKWVKN